MSNLHVYSNCVVDRFVAESEAEAIDLARRYMIDVCGMSPDELDLEFHQDDDALAIRIDWEDDGVFIQRTAGEWAAINGKGFLSSTEF